MAYEKIKFIYNFLTTIISVNTIMCVRLSGGLYYKISSNRIVCVSAAVYCLAACLCISSLIIELNSGNPAQAIRVASSLIIYCSCVVVSLFTDSEYFQGFLSDMETIDVLIGVRPDLDIPVSRFLFLAVIISQLGVAIPFYRFLIENGVPLQMKYLIIPFFVSLCGMTNFTRIMMFELLSNRVRMFRQYLKNTLSRVSKLRDTEDARESIRQCMLIYKKILDTIEKSNTPVKSMIIVTVFASVPKVIATGYELISGAKAAVAQNTLVLHELSLGIILPCVPALLAELTRGEVSRIRLVIGRQILTCEDDRVIEVLDDCLSFLEHRPFRYSVCRLFTLDVGMAISLLNLYVTYSLAMIQFGHFYN